MSIFRKSKGPAFEKPEIPAKPSKVRIYSGKERKMDKRTLDLLTDYTRRTRNILEDMESILKDTTEITINIRTPREQDKIIIDLRKKLNDAEKVNKKCDNPLILAISEIDSELSRYPEMLQVPSYFS